MKHTPSRNRHRIWPLSRYRGRAWGQLRWTAGVVRQWRQAEFPRSGKRTVAGRASSSPRTRERRSTGGTCTKSRKRRSERSIPKPARCSPRSRRPAAAAIQASPGPKERSGSASIAAVRSIRSIRTREPCCARSNPTVSSPASPGSTASFGMAHGRMSKAMSGASIPRRDRSSSVLTCRQGSASRGLNRMVVTDFSAAAEAAASCEPSAGRNASIRSPECSMRVLGSIFDCRDRTGVTGVATFSRDPAPRAGSRPGKAAPRPPRARRMVLPAGATDNPAAARSRTRSGEPNRHRTTTAPRRSRPC